MNVRTKFKVENKLENSGGFAVLFYPVVGGSEENETFYKYTPAGKIELSTINKVAADVFEVGKEYYVDFTLAE